MIDPARKPVQAQQAEPVVKPATTHSVPKCAWSVLLTYLEMYSIHIFSYFNNYTEIALHYSDD